jgi:hypothetical protein
MFARIYKVMGSPMQSGSGSGKWFMDFSSNSKGIDKVMGWVSSSDTMDEVKISFDSQEEAISFAIKNNYQFEIIKRPQPKIVRKSYSDNFI